MSTPPQDPPASGSDDRTRDIRLPSLPDRPPAVVRPERQAHVQPAPVEQSEPGTAPDATAVVSAPRPADPTPPRPYVLPNERTDKLSSPPQGRQQTLAFDPPAAPPAEEPRVVADPGPAQAPAQVGAPVFAPPSFGPPGHGTSSYGPTGHGIAPQRSRRWPWVVLTVLPILVIVAAGLLLLLLLRGA